MTRALAIAALLAAGAICGALTFIVPKKMARNQPDGWWYVVLGWAEWLFPLATGVCLGLALLL
jgi:hypothetical protein